MEKRVAKIAANEFAARKSRRPAPTKSRCSSVALLEKVFVNEG
jgi:hypothetical protein